ncbi:putative oxidoreductase YdbC [compost metagenome]
MTDTVLVTGSSRGIGKAIALRLARAGFDIVLHCRARRDEAEAVQGQIAELGRQGVAYVPFFPLGGFTPLQSETLSSVAARLQASPLCVALAWLLQRAPNLLLIPGTSSVVHLRENLTASELKIPAPMLAELDALA